MMVEFLIRYEKAPLAWVLYRSEADGLMYQQIADNGAISKEDPSSARDWAMGVIREEGSTDYAFHGPGKHETLRMRPQID